MKAKYFVAINLDKHSTFYKKAESFRARYDYKFTIQNDACLLGMIPPFEMEMTSETSFCDEVAEEVSAFFVPEDQLIVKLIGFDVLEIAREFVLLAQFDFSEDIRFCIESLEQITKTYLQQGERIDKSYRNLVLGRFTDTIELTKAIDLLKLEFEIPTTVRVQSISLLSKRSDQWLDAGDFISFKNKENNINNVKQGNFK